MLIYLFKLCNKRGSTLLRLGINNYFILLRTPNRLIRFSRSGILPYLQTVGFGVWLGIVFFTEVKNPLDLTFRKIIIKTYRISHMYQMRIQMELEIIKLI